MAKGLPYFKFTPTEWLTGDIVYESFEVQGLFINICALYWQREGNVSLEDIEKRFKKPTALGSLIDCFISVNDGFISVSFLDEQFAEREYVSSKNSENGKKGGRPKSIPIDSEGTKKPTANRPLTDRKANESQEEKEEEVNKNKKDKPDGFTPFDFFGIGKPIDHRKPEALREACREYWKSGNKKYTQKIFEDFLSHWEALTDKGKMLWKTKATFDLPKRLGTWAKNDKNWNPSQEPKPFKVLYL